MCSGTTGRKYDYPQNITVPAKTSIQELQRDLEKIEPFMRLGMRFLDASPGSIAIQAPLEGNRNDKGTMFAGSIYSVMALAGWALARTICKEQAGISNVVISESQATYLAPVCSDATATASVDGAVEQRSNGNLWVRTVVALRDAGGRLCGELKCRYVGIPQSSHGVSEPCRKQKTKAQQ